MANFNLKALRETLGITQTELAEKMGVHSITVSNWETGKRSMPEVKRKRFLKLYDLHDITPETVGVVKEEEEGLDLRPRKPPTWWTSPIGLCTSELWTDEERELFRTHYLPELWALGTSLPEDTVLDFYHDKQFRHDTWVYMLNFESLGMIRISEDGKTFDMLDSELWSERQRQHLRNDLSRRERERLRNDVSDLC
jgi:transcriptional regulator with XRE-family HTH domain